MSLVAEYYSNSSESDISENENCDSNKNSNCVDSKSENCESSSSEDSSNEKGKTLFLPLPSSLLHSKVDIGKRKLNKNSVYSNQYLQEQNDTVTLLSKHTNLSSNQINNKDNSRKRKNFVKNKKKLCLHFFKHGTCKYESQCKFLHSLQQVNEEETSSSRNSGKLARFNQSTEVVKTNPIQDIQYIDNEVDIKDNWHTETKVNSRKRPGLSDNIKPSKKVAKMYRKNNKPT